MRKYIIMALSAIAFTVSCSKELDLVNPNALSQESFWSSENDAQLALAGVYDALQSNNIFGGDFRENGGFGGEGLFQWRTDALPLSEGNTTTENQEYFRIWRAHYNVVNRANLVIANVQKDIPGLSEAKSKIILAEAKFCRALAYLNLTMYYRDVPLITEPQSFSERFVSVADQSMIIDLIYSDLDYAVENAVETSNDGHADKWAALALRARAKLYFQDWTQTVEDTGDIIASGKFGLYPNFGNLFHVEAEGSEESIFAIRFEENLNGEGESFSGTYLRVTRGTMVPLPSYIDRFYATDGLPIDQSPLYDPNNNFNNRDPRLDYSVLKSKELWVNNKPINLNSPTNYNMQKYERNALGNYNDGPQDFMVIRYADILLMRAEALVEIGNTSQEVYDLIDQVRQRPSVDMPKVEDVEGTGLNKQQLLDIIYHERWVEFGFEGLNFFDLKRWGLLEQTYSEITFHQRMYSNRVEVWPIPQREIDNNPSLVQHPEWQ